MKLSGRTSRNYGEEVLGRRKAQHREWISPDTMNKSDLRKEKEMALNTRRTKVAKAKVQEYYRATNKVSEVLGETNETTLTAWPSKQKKQLDKEI